MVFFDIKNNIIEDKEGEVVELEPSPLFLEKARELMAKDEERRLRAIQGDA